MSMVMARAMGTENGQGSGPANAKKIRISSGP